MPSSGNPLKIDKSNSPSPGRKFKTKYPTYKLIFYPLRLSQRIKSRFTRLLKRSILKTLWVKEKMLETNIFSFSHNVFGSTRKQLHRMSQVSIVILAQNGKIPASFFHFIPKSVISPKQKRIKDFLSPIKQTKDTKYH